VSRAPRKRKFLSILDFGAYLNMAVAMDGVLDPRRSNPSTRPAEPSEEHARSAHQNQQDQAEGGDGERLGAEPVLEEQERRSVLVAFSCRGRSWYR
jgi:hypothetical protein